MKDMSGNNDFSSKPPITVNVDEQTQIEIVPLYVEQDYGNVSGITSSLEKVMEGIQSISRTAKEALESAMPDEAAIEFKVGFGVKTNGVLAVLVNADMDAALKVTLKWKKN